MKPSKSSKREPLGSAPECDSTLRDAVQQLSIRYRTQQRPFLREPLDYWAYAASRMPATQQVIARVLQELPEHAAVNSVLDIGAGPGSSADPLLQRFPALAQMTFLETDPYFIELGKQYTPSHAVWQRAAWPCAVEPADIVLMSYSLGEMPEPVQQALTAFAQAKQYLILIEPGTPAGYANLMAVRTALIAQQASIIAPCPHARPCPLQAPDWCHFPVRVMRTAAHRFLKQAALGYEDEKFIYLVVGKQPNLAAPYDRIIDRPHYARGHVEFKCCTADGQCGRVTISKREKEIYKTARKKSWGDPLA